jgi:hypothetical protein
VSKPIPKAIASAVMLTVAAAALLSFTRGEGPRPDALSSASVPDVSGTNAPNVTGHAKSHHQAKHKPKATSAPSAQDPATTTPTTAPTTIATSAASPSAPHGTKAPGPVSSPSPDPSPSPTSNGGLLDILEDVLNPHH